MTGLGSLKTFMDALVGLEATIDPNLVVTRWRPAKISPPALYNWIIPSPADIPATGIVRDQMTIAVRVLVTPAEITDETAALEAYFDQVRDTIDQDLIEPARSVLSAACLMCRRTTTRSINDVFNDITYLGLEIVLQAEFRRRFV